MNEPTFETKVLTGIESIGGEVTKLKTTQAELCANYDRLQSETKTAFEDLTKVKSAANSLTEITNAMQRVQLQLQRELRLANGDPVARFCADPDKSLWLNAVARKIAFPSQKLPEAMEKALTGVDSGLGQATVPTAYLGEIYDVLSAYGAYNTLNVMRNIPARTTYLPMMATRPAYYWIGAGTGGTAEGSAITEGAFTGSSVALAIQTLAVYLTVSRELLQDSTADMAGTILREMAKSIAYGIDFMAFAADAGADQTDAGYYGIFTTNTVHTGCVNQAASTHTTVATTTLADWIGTINTATAEVNRRACKWWMHPTILAKAALIVDSNGRPIFQTALEAPSTTMGSILGRPVVTVDAAPSTDSANALVAVYGDPDAYVVGIRQDLELAQSEHIKFAENLLAYRALVRCGGKHRVPASNPAGFKPLIVLKLAAS